MITPRILRDTPDNVLRVVNNETIIGLTLNDVLIASNGLNDTANLARIFAFIEAEERPTARIAHFGAGLAWLPKMLMGLGYEQDIYEIDQDIIGCLQEGSLGRKANFILGDWHATLGGQYDFVIYDTGQSMSAEDSVLIQCHLNKGGKIYVN